LQVNKIHFILASGASADDLMQATDACMENCREQYDLPSREELWKSINATMYYDGPEINYVKRMLQRELPEQERNQLVDVLFTKYVSADETDFANALYMSEAQMQELIERGHYIGGHGFSHQWLSHLDDQALQTELDETLRFLKKIGTPTDHWMLAYPFGGYRTEQFERIAQAGCRVALTVKHGVASLPGDHPLELPRIDTNERPH